MGSFDQVAAKPIDIGVGVVVYDTFVISGEYGNPARTPAVGVCQKSATQNHKSQS
jgi:hypothetical protein